MRFSASLPALALLAMALPAVAQQAAPAQTPATPELNTAPSVTPAPEGVSDEIDRQLWCGHAFSFVAKQAEAAGDAGAATQMTELGTVLIDRGSKGLTDTGFTPERLEATKAAYVTQIGTELSGDGSAAKFSYQDCATLAQ